MTTFGSFLKKIKSYFYSLCLQTIAEVDLTFRGKHNSVNQGLRGKEVVNKIAKDSGRELGLGKEGTVLNNAVD